ncbi:MAG: Gfo/Idh/MocA family oxidoreductase [Promethearchaeota archaeon]
MKENLLKLGMVGLDTSHVPGFMQDIQKNKKLNAKVLFGYPGGSDLTSVSRDRVMKFTMRAGQLGADIIEDLDVIAEKSDGIILTSCDGRQHLEQMKVLAKHGKPIFVDKPFSCSLVDAKAIIKLSEKYKTPLFSASSLRYAKGIYEFGKGKKIQAAEAYGPVKILDDYPGWFWYGVHSAEILFELLGPGVKDVEVVASENVDIVTSNWNHGRKGICFGYRYEKFNRWGARLWTRTGMEDTVALKKPSFSELMVPHIIKFLRDGVSPVDTRTMVEIMAYLEAVNEAKETGRKITISI